MHSYIVPGAIVLWIVELKDDRQGLEEDYFIYTLIWDKAAVTSNDLIHSLTQYLLPFSTTNSVVTILWPILVMKHSGCREGRLSAISKPDRKQGKWFCIKDLCPFP